MCFLSATHSFDGKNLYRKLEIGGKTCHFARDTDFCAVKGVSRHETWPDDRKTVRDTQFNAKKGVSRQGKVVGKRTATGKSRVLRSRSGSGRG